MSTRLDGLFGRGASRPSRARWIAALLVLGLPLDLLGLVSCTAVPGALLTLAAWMLAESDLARIESGFLPVAHARVLNRLKAVATGALLLCVFSFAVQIVLLSNGSFERWLGWLDRRLR